jgi:phage gpG-like protein
MSLLDAELLNFSELLKAFAGIDLEEVSEAAVTEGSAVLLDRLRKRFLRQVSPDEVPWEPSFAAFRRSFGIGRNGRKVRAGGGTLFDTGTLFNSIQLYSVSPLEMSIATDVFYAPYHNEGTKTLPKREFMGFSEEDADTSVRVFFDVIDRALQ